jgi:hypothetical protein
MGVGLAALAGCGLHFSPNVEAKEDWTRRYTLTSGGSFEVRETNGRVQVRGGDGDAVEVTATKIGRGIDDTAARQALARIEIREEVSPASIVLDSTAKSGGPSFGESRTVNYVVTLPRRSQLTIKTTNGEIGVENVAGRVTVTTTNGSIRASGLESETKVAATNGEVVLEFARLGGGVTCETTNGTISVTVPRNAAADVSMRVTNGEIGHSNLDLKVKEETRRRLDAAIGGGGPEVKLETTNGEIQLRGK